MKSYQSINMRINYCAKKIIFTIAIYNSYIACMQPEEVTIVDERNDSTAQRSIWSDKPQIQIPKAYSQFPSLDNLASNEIHKQVAEKQRKIGLPLNFPILVFNNSNVPNGVYNHANLGLIESPNRSAETSQDITEWQIGQRVAHIRSLYDTAPQVYTAISDRYQWHQLLLACSIPLITFGLLSVGMLKTTGRLLQITPSPREEALLIMSGTLAVGGFCAYVGSWFYGYRTVAYLQQQKLEYDTKSCYLGKDTEPQEVIRLAQAGQQYIRNIPLSERIVHDASNILFPTKYPSFYRRITNLQRIIDEKNNLLTNKSEL
ncbi:MAG TPA: hypothetical protein VGW78_04345 [Candidatus Babeliales bacterium]|nr:hypothetical protein [Candidatus Babeliales bacterium]